MCKNDRSNVTYEARLWVFVLITGESQKGGQEEGGTEEAVIVEAASPGAAGQLTGAKERTGQEQWYS